jgi:hypothetical protein
MILQCLAVLEWVTAVTTHYIKDRLVPTFADACVVIHGCIKSIPEATAITLTNEERTELEGLARSTKTEHRLGQRARIVLLSADGLATRAIGRAVGCTT